MADERGRRAKVVVTFDDGHTEEFNPNRPRFLLDMENRWGIQEPARHEHIMWLAHHALVTFKGGDTPLETWIDTVDDVQTVVLDDKPSEGKDDSSAA